ncbi:MAG: DUF3168 domain-containing protein [Endomicrobia bacterium]|nr:DUF3168 domain-containing protein [Endomicrobiia bacterium]
MSIGVKLYNYLLQNTAITSLLPNSIYPVLAPDGAQKPYLAFRVVSDLAEYTLDGDAGQGNKTIQISVIFEDYLQANSIAETVEQEIAKWAAVEPDIQVITKTGYSELYDEDLNVKRIDLEYTVFAKN